MSSKKTPLAVVTEALHDCTDQEDFLVDTSEVVAQYVLDRLRAAGYTP